MVGLGRMGKNMSERLRQGGHTVVGFDHDPAVSDVGSLNELVERLPTPRAVWVMVPAGAPTTDTLEELAGLLSEGDVVVDGGNSRYTESVEHARRFGETGVGFLDCGVSGGIWGLTEGYGLMVGGAAEHVAVLEPAFETLRPPQGGYVHAGPAGSGHFTKMVHNGVEYGLMQAYAEGYELMASSPFEIDVPAVVEAWRQGTVIRSWLLDLLARALEADDDLSELRGYAQDSGEGRWTVAAAIDSAVPLPVITAALFARFASRQEDSPAMKVVAALRNQFGGHAVTSAKGAEEPSATAPAEDADGGDVPPPPTANDPAQL